MNRCYRIFAFYITKKNFNRIVENMNKFMYSNAFDNFNVNFIIIVALQKKY